MFKRFFPSLLLISVVCIAYLSCDSPPGLNSVDNDLPYVQNLSVTPTNIQFNPALDGQKDTTITLNVTVDGFDFGVESVPYYYIFIDDNESPALEGKFLGNLTQQTSFQANVGIPTNTIDFKTYTVLVTPSLNSPNQNYAQARVTQTGVPTIAPEILAVSNPDTVFRPSSGENIALFTVKATDVDGQDNIEKVQIRIIDQEVGEAQGSPFEMFDDGSTYSDVAANDSVYTFSLPVTPTTNRPNRDFNIEYFALDKSGLSSDTVKVIFRIRE